jgi:hypothetical protein
MVSRIETGCPVYEQTGEAIELLFGNGLFRPQGRLTALGDARNIVCTRTKCPVTKDAKVWPSDSLTLACELVHAN